jgi:branched-chain amino acid transport system ATP-binding protein
MGEPHLEIRGLVKRFGGLLATDHVSLTVPRGEMHAIIGPNGAGKTTLINGLQGELAPDEGTVLLDGEDITRWTSARRAQAGMARVFQITSVFKEFSALDNVMLAVQGRLNANFSFFRNARREAALRDPARALLEQVGLGARASVEAQHLAHGEQRQLELAMALATQPQLLLLDEPMAGMGKAESEEMMRLLRGLKREITILLVEHDMDVVFALADRVSVLVNGAVLMTAAPDEVRANAEVRTAYLGTDDAGADNA